MSLQDYRALESTVLMIGALCIGISVGMLIHLTVNLIWKIIAKYKQKQYKRKLLDEVLQGVRRY